MNASELVTRLQVLINLNPDAAHLHVMMRSGNQQLRSIDEITIEADSFETRIELA